MAIPSITLEAYHDAIEAYLKPLFPDIQYWGRYERAENLPMPAIFIQVTDFENIGQDRDDGRLEMMMNINIHVMHHFKDADARMQVRLLAVSIAEKCHRQQFSLPLSPAEVQDITHDPFDKNHETYEKMLIEMSQSGIFGSYDEADDFIANQVFAGITPKIGADHEEDYLEVTDG
ncbi:MAG: hypothetical protein AAF621_00490 [Pseudomonadota bacterium]